MFMEHLKVPRGLNRGRTSRGGYERASVRDEPLFVRDIEAASCVLLAPHRISLKDFTSLHKKPEGRGGPFPVWGYPWVQPENTTTQTQAEDLFCRWVSLKNFTVHELKELREGRLLSYVLDQGYFRIKFAHLIAKRQLHFVMEGLRQRSKSSAQDERGYGSVNPGEELWHAFEYVAPSQPYPSGPSTSGRNSVGSLLNDEVRQLRDRVYAIGIALGLEPGINAASHAGKPRALVVLCRDLDALGRETRVLHGRVDRRVLASALKELRRGLDALCHEVHGRMPSYEPPYNSGYGYISYPSSSHSVPSYHSYDSGEYQPGFHSQSSTPVTPAVHRTQTRFEEVSSHLGLPSSEKEDPVGRDTA
ncbi:ABC Superfamily [Phytophthora palmivora]|uniref:ABC Superfamily n=1 Tax=Phytophthora palmivora TaxID=4796 RepID=A0A2P4XFZ1_9STRA|nr:ABC Superfamily [Phytophthora palmivora]